MATHQGHHIDAENVELGEEKARQRTEELWVELKIEPDTSLTCPAATDENESVNGTIQLTGEQCHATIQFTDESTPPAVMRTSIEETCTCKVVCDSDVTLSDLRIEDGSLIIKASVKSRETLVALTDRLRENGDEWHLRRLQSVSERSNSGSDTNGNILQDVSITEKQREIVQVAVSKGYYANPREASLSDLAEEVDVTRSALSQRLNAVEAKLIETLSSEL